MINLVESKLIDLIPPNLRDDPDIIAASASVDKEYAFLIESIKNCLVFVGIDSVKEELLDLLAIELHADFYDMAMSVEKKRDVVRNTLVYHYYKGTPFVVEQLVTDAFDDSTIQEWFEYDGDPFKFKISTTDRITDSEKLKDLIRAINSVKNKRSWIDSINIKRENRLELKTTIVNRQSKHISLYSEV